VFAHRDFLRACYLACANLEADIALARHLLGRDDWYWSVRSDSTALAPGVLAHTNGISLLAKHGFGAGIERSAARVCAWLGAREVAVEGETAL
jgi:hypothetical protein